MNRSVVLGCTFSVVVLTGCAAIGIAALGALGRGLIVHGLQEQGQATERQQFPPATPSPMALENTKFCPMGGETYPEDMKYCPIHGVELRYKDAGTSSAPTTNAPTTSTPTSSAPATSTSQTTQ